MFIGLGFIIAPFIFKGVFVFEALIEKVGLVAAIFMCISLPLYTFSIVTVFKKVKHLAQIVAVNPTNINLTYSTHELIIIGSLVVCIIIYKIATYLHQKKNGLLDEQTEGK